MNIKHWFTKCVCHLAMGCIYLSLACASAVQPRIENSANKTRGAQTEEPLKIAKRLQESGHYLEASIFFEAAIANGCDERTLLPHLIASQIRSGRLRAAKKNVVRLHQIAPKPVVIELVNLLVRLTPNPDTPASGEAQ
ncbi:MAG: hypothetical protein QNJ97_12720 [Myxococcota bacterium]|nr:hypothetical protein [Myxococcota bacterium]